MANNLDRTLVHVFEFEGGWSDHPADPGGATNMGITLETFRQWRKNPHATKDELRRMTKAEATEIYRERYWKPVRGDELPHGVDLSVMDMGVNAGTGTSIRHLQEVLGVTVDGRLGPQTLGACAAADHTQVIDKLHARHERYYRSLNTFSTFGRGWLRRNDARRKEAHAIRVAGSTTTVA